MILTRYERGLEDPLQRRKIQNRIAQRAYSRFSVLARCSLPDYRDGYLNALYADA